MTRRASATTAGVGFVAGRRPVVELLRSGRAVEKILVADNLAPSGVIGDIRTRAEGAGVPLKVVPRPEVDKVAGGTNHQGVVAVTGPYRYAPLDALLRREAPCLLLVDGVTDPHNLGSLLRSADGAGMTGVVIPAHRSAAVTSAARRVSAGASELVSVAKVANLGLAITAARDAGLWIVGMDEKADEDLWSSRLMEPPVALVVGSEDRGLSPTVRKACDALVRIPLGGHVGSLNVGVAGAIAMFEIARRRNPSATLTTRGGAGPR